MLIPQGLIPEEEELAELLAMNAPLFDAIPLENDPLFVDEFQTPGTV